ncbi:TIGR01244 family sulfur transferase [Pararhodobacter oceanensis]|uniref:TIGR01244 family sulfur transferase n=1 Tax=Pararhodobacter oceanensis TaxID=2172121 RepID=UPI003A94CF66
MDIRPLTETYAVSPQIQPEDIQAIADAGYAMVICNRPDGEIPPELAAETLRPLVEAAGMGFVVNPVVGGALTTENVEAQRAAMDGTERKVLAYCASGNRSSIVWALAMAGRLPTDALIEAGAAYGYQIGQFRELIEGLAQKAE